MAEKDVDSLTVTNQLPLLFDGQLKPKPAYQAIIDVAAGKYPLTKP